MILEDATKILFLQNTEISFVVGDEVDYDVLCPNITLKIFKCFGFEGEKQIRVLNQRQLQLTA